MTTNPPAPEVIPSDAAAREAAGAEADQAPQTAVPSVGVLAMQQAIVDGQRRSIAAAKHVSLLVFRLCLLIDPPKPEEMEKELEAAAQDASDVKEDMALFFPYKTWVGIVLFVAILTRPFLNRFLKRKSRELYLAAKAKDDALRRSSTAGAPAATTPVI